MNSESMRKALDLVEGNMSYCRWENTADDLQDCVNSMGEWHQSAYDHERGEIAPEDDDGRTVFDNLSETERAGYYQVLALAAQILEYAEHDHLQTAGVNLSRLG